MWYKYFNKESWNLRIWRQLEQFRKQNLKYLQDDYGMFRHKNLYRWKDFIFRLSRNEGHLRFAILIFSTALIPIISQLKSTYYDPVYIAPKKIEQERVFKQKDEEARQVLFYNRFGAPSRPTRTMDEMIAFLSGSETYEQLADFNSYNVSANIALDQSNGLDSWMSEKDKNMLKYYKESLKHGH